jgi:hypothetical protein
MCFFLEVFYEDKFISKINGLIKGGVLYGAKIEGR